VAVDLRLYLKDRLLDTHASIDRLVGGLLRFATRYRTALWPGFTHTRAAMPSTAGLWAAAHAEGLLDSLEALPALWSRLDRSPLGSAAGYGVPLPLDREAVQRALGFGGLDHNVATVQNGRGKLEADVLFWCVQIGHDLSRLSGDAILYSAAEYGLLRLPEAFTTGSSIMPQKRNPDVFEVTRGRVATLAGDLTAVLAVRSNLTSGYHRDFQLLKAPLFHGLDQIEGAVDMLGRVVPLLEVDRARGRQALGEGGLLVTDEALRRVEEGVPFREAYRQVSEEYRAGGALPVPSPADVLSRRNATGAPGNPGIPAARARLRAARRWRTREHRRFEGAIGRLSGARGSSR
jgi:argininosuccinate lyase